MTRQRKANQETRAVSGPHVKITCMDFILTGIGSVKTGGTCGQYARALISGQLFIVLLTKEPIIVHHASLDLVSHYASG